MALRLRDDLDRDVVISRPPRRIVSLVPSDTDTLFALGVGDRVVGRTRYCVEPAGRVEHIPTCGGTKDIDIDAVLALEPDLVLCNQEENARAPLEKLAEHRHIQVFVALPLRMADGIAHIARLARMLGVMGEPATRDLALDLIRRGHHAVAEARSALAAQPESRALPVFMPIWMDPLMTLSGDTFGSDMLTMAGARNVFGDRRRLYPLIADLGKAEPWSAGKVARRDIRYPRITLDEMVARAPRVLLLPDEPHPFTESDAALLRDAFADADVPVPEVRFIDGKHVFWHGARSIDGLYKLRALITELSERVSW